MTAGRGHQDAVLAMAARFVTQAERRRSAQSRTVEELAGSPLCRPAAELMLHEMQQTLALAHLYEDFLRSLEEA